MAYSGGNPNGLATSANSAPVVIASDNVVDTASNQVMGNGTITAVDSGSTVGSGQSSQVLITGTPTANSVYALAIPNVNGAPESFSSIVITITGTFVGTYQFERSPDSGTTWTPFSPFVAGQPQAAATGTLPGMFHGNIAGVTNVRVRCTAYTSGTMAVRFSMGNGAGTVTVGNPIRLYDMANNAQASIKPAATAPVAGDTSIVTTEHPNSPLLTGTLNVKQAGDATASGTISAVNTGVSTATLSGVSGASVQVSGTWVGTLTPQATIDGSNWVAMGPTSLLNVGTTSYSGTIASGSSGIWQADVSGFLGFRIYFTAYTSGSATITIRSTSASGMVGLDAPLPAGSNSIGSVSVSNDALTTGSLGSNGATLTTAALIGASTVGIQVTGTFVATITPSVSLDNTNWINLGATGLVNANTGQYGSTIGSVSVYQANISSFNYFRLTVTSYTSGTAVITIKASSASGTTALSAPLPPGSSTVGKVYVTSATGDVATKAASTAVAAADISLAVGLSPNSPLPVGSNVIGKTYLTGVPGDVAVKAGSTAAVVGDVSLVVAHSPNSSLPTGGNTIGNVNITSGQGIGLNPQATSSALTIYSNQALAATVQYIKTSAARMHEYDFYNPNTSGVWIQLFNAASGVTLGTTAPTRTIYLPASAGRDLTSPFSANWSSGLAIACTTTNTGSTAPASAIQVYIGYV